MIAFGNVPSVEIHTATEIAAEVDLLRADAVEVEKLTRIGVLRPWCFEVDLRTEAYNRLTEKKWMT